MIVSNTDQVLSVCPTVIPKYSLINQNPASFTCEKTNEPEPVASTKSSGLTATPAVAAIGATILHAVAIATVADPVAKRINAATNQPNNNGDRFAFNAVETISLEIINWNI